MYPTTRNLSLFSILSVLLHLFWSFYHMHVHLGLLHPGFSNLSFMCLYVVLFMYLTEFCWAPWTWVFRVFIKFRNFPTTISSIFFLPLSFLALQLYICYTNWYCSTNYWCSISSLHGFCFTLGSVYHYCLRNHWSFFSVQSNPLLILPYLKIPYF